MWWLGCIMAGTALLIHLLVLDAHEHQPPRLSTSGILLVLGAALSAVAGGRSVGTTATAPASPLVGGVPRVGCRVAPRQQALQL